MKNKAVKDKICKSCNEKFVPTQPLQMVCSYNCALDATRKHGLKQREKESKKEVAKMKEGLLTKSDYEKVLQTHINTIARLIDYGCSCISCGHLKRAFAGHFHSVGANRSLRFHLDNIHVQDFNCNGERGGNIPAYGRGLVNWYGQEYKDYVESQLVKDYPVMKWDANELKCWTKKAKAIVKELKDSNAYYDSTQRLELRNYFNQRLGIYK